MALWEARQEDTYLERVKFVVTGDVPYERGSKTLAWLMREYLIEAGADSQRVIIGSGGGIFSESRNITSGIKRRWPDTEIIEVVSSDWYFLPAWLLWKKFGGEQGLKVKVIIVENTGGPRTRIMYALYGALVWLAALIDKVLCPIFRLSALRFLGECITKMQSGRKDGFKINNCR